MGKIYKIQALGLHYNYHFYCIKLTLHHLIGLYL